MNFPETHAGDVVISSGVPLLFKIDKPVPKAEQLVICRVADIDNPEKPRLIGGFDVNDSNPNNDLFVMQHPEAKSGVQFRLMWLTNAGQGESLEPFDIGLQQGAKKVGTFSIDKEILKTASAGFIYFKLIL